MYMQHSLRHITHIMSHIYTENLFTVQHNTHHVTHLHRKPFHYPTQHTSCHIFTQKTFSLSSIAHIMSHIYTENLFTVQHSTHHVTHLHRKPFHCSLVSVVLPRTLFSSRFQHSKNMIMLTCNTSDGFCSLWEPSFMLTNSITCFFISSPLIFSFSRYGHSY